MVSLRRAVAMTDDGVKLAVSSAVAEEHRERPSRIRLGERHRR
jgi:hypothetical protein